MKLKELQQKINELVEQGYENAIVCNWNDEWGEYEELLDVNIKEFVEYRPEFDCRKFAKEIIEFY